MTSASGETVPAPPAEAPSAHDEAPAAAPDDGAATKRCLGCTAALPAGAGFCPDCGHRASVERITLRRLVSDFAGSLMSLETATLRTLRGLFTRPGRVTRAYVAGERQRYLSPLRYFVFIVAVNFVGRAAQTLAGFPPRGIPTDGGFWADNFQIAMMSLRFALFLVPLALAQRLLYRRADVTFAEHYVLLLYVMSQTLLLLVVTNVALAPFHADPMGLTEQVALGAVLIGYLGWAGHDFFDEPAWQSVAKGIASLVLALAASAATSFLLALVAA